MKYRRWVLSLSVAIGLLGCGMGSLAFANKGPSCDPRKGGNTVQCKPKKPASKPVLKVVSQARNVLGSRLVLCSRAPMTGYFRDGFCHTGPSDRGVHVVCAKMTAAFLAYTKSRGNDLSTPVPRYRFPGLKPGDRWCLCAVRWLEAHRAGKAPMVVLQATNRATLRIVKKPILVSKAHKHKKKR